MSICLQKDQQTTKVAKARTELSKKKSETHTSSAIVLFLAFKITARALLQQSFRPEFFIS